MNIKHLLGVCALAASMALSAAGSASALIYEQVYTGALSGGNIPAGLFGGVLNGGNALTVRFVTDTSLGSGIVDGPDGQAVHGGYSSGTSAPVSAYITIDGHDLNLTDNIAQSKSELRWDAGQFYLTNAVTFYVDSGYNFTLTMSAQGATPAPVTFGQAYSLSSLSTSLFTLSGANADVGLFIAGYATSAEGRVISAVPEPATWALMMFGFAGLGGALRASRPRQPATA